MGDAKRRKAQDPNYGQPRYMDLRPDKSRSFFDNLPPGTSEDDYLDYLDQNWDMMAIFAYESSLREGKGVLVLDWDLSLDAYLNLLSPGMRRINDRRFVTKRQECPIFYVSDRGPMGEFLDTDMRAMVQRYNPEFSIVLFLCWGFEQGTKGQVMGRTLALGNHKTPAQLYIDHADRQREFSFFAGSDKAPPAAPSSRVIRAFQASFQQSHQFRQILKTVFQEGIRKEGKGAVVAMPDRSGEGVLPVFLAVDQIAGALGADVNSGPFRQALGFIDRCQPDTQIVVIVIDEGMHTSENFTYYSFLLKTSGDDSP